MRKKSKKTCWVTFSRSRERLRREATAWLREYGRVPDAVDLTEKEVLILCTIVVDNPRRGEETPKQRRLLAELREHYEVLWEQQLRARRKRHG